MGFESLPPATKTEKPKNRLDDTLEKYSTVITAREKLFDADIKKAKEAVAKSLDTENEDAVKTRLRNMEMMRGNLVPHNNIVLHYSLELIEKLELTKPEKVAAKIATILHDSGKLAAPLLEHHTKGVEYAAIVLKKMFGKKFEGVMVDEQICEKVLQAINRHMNHPYLVFINKGIRFPEPEDTVDKIVFDADMLANTGFKNVAFRLADPKNMAIDAAATKTKIEQGQKTCPLAESFENVIAGVRNIEKTILLPESKETLKKALEAVEKIYEYLKNHTDNSLRKDLLKSTDEKELSSEMVTGSNIFEQIQNLFSNEDGFSSLSILDNNRGETPGQELIKELLNKQIAKAAKALGIEAKLASYFMM